MSWTDERIDLLKQLWGEGHSASQIASQLGGVTRNAVIGKVHRLKLDSRLKAPAPLEQPVLPRVQRPVLVETPAVAEAPPAPRILSVPAPSAPPVLAAPPVPPRPARPATFGATALKIDVEPEEEILGHIEVEREPGEVVPISRNLTLVQLSDRTCKWPLGDPLSDEFRFCGNHAPDASPYCQHHARIAFQPVSERRRVR